MPEEVVLRVVLVQPIALFQSVSIHGCLRKDPVALGACQSLPVSIRLNSRMPEEVDFRPTGHVHDRVSIRLNSRMPEEVGVHDEQVDEGIGFQSVSIHGCLRKAPNRRQPRHPISVSIRLNSRMPEEVPRPHRRRPVRGGVSIRLNSRMPEEATQAQRWCRACCCFNPSQFTDA